MTIEPMRCDCLICDRTNLGQRVDLEQRAVARDEHGVEVGDERRSRGGGRASETKLGDNGLDLSE